MAFWQWSLVAATNATADPNINWAEGQSPSSVNDSARVMMAALAAFRDDTNGKLATAGGPIAYTVTTNEVLNTPTPTDGQRLVVRFNVANGAASTLAADGGSPFPIVTAPGAPLASGAVAAGAPYALSFNAAAAAWILNGFYTVPLGPNTVSTSNIQNSAVTYAKIQNETNGTLLGNVSGAPAAPQEINIGPGLSVVGTTLSACAPIQGNGKNKKIVTVTNTTVNVTADAIIVSDGAGNFSQVAINSTGGNVLNLGSAGGLNKLDTGSIAIDTWYAIYAIALPGGASPGTIASASFTAPNLAWGAYTQFAYMGAVQTIHASAVLYGMRYDGNQGKYVVGLLNTTASVMAVTGIAGSTYSVITPNLVSVSLTRFVPPTAGKVNLSPALNQKGAGIGSVIIAPSIGPYSGTNNGPNGTNGPFTPTGMWDQSQLSAGVAFFHGSVELQLEGALTFGYAGSNAGSGVAVNNWTDGLCVN